MLYNYITVLQVHGLQRVFKMASCLLPILNYMLSEDFRFCTGLLGSSTAAAVLRKGECVCIEPQDNLL